MKRASRSLKSTTSRWLFTLTQTCMYQRINNHAIKVLVQQNFTWTLRFYHSSMKDTKPYMNKLLVVWCLGGTKHLTTNVFKTFNAWNFMKFEVVRGLFQECRMNEEEHSNLWSVRFPKIESGGSGLFNGWILTEPYLEATCSFAWHYFFSLFCLHVW